MLKASTGEDSDPTLLRGAVGRIRLASLLQLAEGEALTGRLDLEGRGQVAFVAGEVVAAACGELSGLPAIRELFLVADAPFSLRSTPPRPGARIAAMAALVIEGCRIADEWERLAPCRLRVARPGAPEAALARLEAALDGGRTLRQAARRAGIPPSTVIDAVLAAIEAGALEHAGPPAPEAERDEEPVPPTPDDAYDGAMDRARRCLAAGDLDGAEAAIREALVARPDDRIALQNHRRVCRLRESGMQPRAARLAGAQG